MSRIYCDNTKNVYVQLHSSIEHRIEIHAAQYSKFCVVYVYGEFKAAFDNFSEAIEYATKINKDLKGK